MPRRTQGLPRLLHDFGYGSFTLFAAPSPALLLSCRIDFLGSPITPSSDGLGSSAFARHYLRNRFYFLLLQVLRCFSSLRIASLARCHPRGWRVPPFGYRRVVACLLLAVAFRRLLRPSSPPGVQASTIRSSSLNLKCSFCAFLVCN